MFRTVLRSNQQHRRMQQEEDIMHGTYSGSSAIIVLYYYPRGRERGILGDISQTCIHARRSSVYRMKYWYRNAQLIPVALK